jgi:hypothetical protein
MKLYQAFCLGSEIESAVPPTEDCNKIIVIKVLEGVINNCCSCFSLLLLNRGEFSFVLAQSPLKFQVVVVKNQLCQRYLTSVTRKVKTEVSVHNNLDWNIRNYFCCYLHLVSTGSWTRTGAALWPSEHSSYGAGTVKKFVSPLLEQHTSKIVVRCM